MCVRRGAGPCVWTLYMGGKRTCNSTYTEAQSESLINYVPPDAKPMTSHNKHNEQSALVLIGLPDLIVCSHM